MSSFGPVRRERLWLAAILAAGLLLRLAHWAAARDQPFFGFLALDSLDYDRWGRALAAGTFQSNEPFFLAPLYPYGLAFVYRFVSPSLDAVYLVQIALALVGLFALHRAGRVLFGPREGLVAAALAATYPPLLVADSYLQKESLAATVTALLLWALAAARSDRKAGVEAARTTGGGVRALLPWLAAGALLGALSLLRENALLLPPFLLPLAWRQADATGALRRVAAFAAGLVLALAPVAAHNARTGGGLLPTTYNGGLNFFIGNNAKADGTYRPVAPGKQTPELARREASRIAEAALGRPLTPGEVSRHWLGRGLAWARESPLAFARLQARKLALFFGGYEVPDAFDFYWLKTLSPALRLPLFDFAGLSLLAAFGLWLGRKRLADVAPAALFALGWAATTALFFVSARFRLPAVPALALLAAPALVALGEAIASRETRDALRLGAPVAAAWLVSTVPAREPRLDLVHFNVGLLLEARGDAPGAARAYVHALAADPNHYLACLNLGALAGRRRDFGEAIAWLSRAVEIQPGSEEAWSSLGGAYLGAGDLANARRSLETAYRLNPKNPATVRSLELLALAEARRAKPPTVASPVAGR